MAVNVTCPDAVQLIKCETEALEVAVRGENWTVCFERNTNFVDTPPANI